MKRAPKTENPYIDLLDSDSEPPEQQKASLSQSFRPPSPNYQDVLSFKQLKVNHIPIQETTSLTRNFFELKEFFQNRNNNVLFLFGPSGCGKTLLL